MNKFSKTSYSRHFNHESFLNSSHQANERRSEGEEMEGNRNRPKIQESENSKPLQSLIEKKIEIDPSLLLTSKPNQWQGRNSKAEKYPIGNSELSTTLNDGFKKGKDRPESKKQSRIRISECSALKSK